MELRFILAAAFAGLVLGLNLYSVPVILNWHASLNNCANQGTESGCLAGPKQDCVWLNQTCYFKDYETLNCSLYDNSSDICVTYDDCQYQFTAKKCLHRAGMTPAERGGFASSSVAGGLFGVVGQKLFGEDAFGLLITAIVSYIGAALFTAAVETDIYALWILAQIIGSFVGFYMSGIMANYFRRTGRLTQLQIGILLRVYGVTVGIWAILIALVFYFDTPRGKFSEDPNFKLKLHGITAGLFCVGTCLLLMSMSTAYPDCLDCIFGEVLCLAPSEEEEEREDKEFEQVLMKKIQKIQDQLQKSTTPSRANGGSPGASPGMIRVTSIASVSSNPSIQQQQQQELQHIHHPNPLSVENIRKQQEQEDQQQRSQSRKLTTRQKPSFIFSPSDSILVESVGVHSPNNNSNRIVRGPSSPSPLSVASPSASICWSSLRFQRRQYKAKLLRRFSSTFNTLPELEPNLQVAYQHTADDYSDVALLVKPLPAEAQFTLEDIEEIASPNLDVVFFGDDLNASTGTPFTPKAIEGERVNVASSITTATAAADDAAAATTIGTSGSPIIEDGAFSPLRHDNTFVVKKEREQEQQQDLSYSPAIMSLNQEQQRQQISSKNILKVASFKLGELKESSFKEEQEKEEKEKEKQEKEKEKGEEKEEEQIEFDFPECCCMSSKKFFVYGSALLCCCAQQFSGIPAIASFLPVIFSSVTSDPIEAQLYFASALPVGSVAAFAIFTRFMSATTTFIVGSFCCSFASLCIGLAIFPGFVEDKAQQSSLAAFGVIFFAFSFGASGSSLYIATLAEIFSSSPFKKDLGFGMTLSTSFAAGIQTILRLVFPLFVSSISSDIRVGRGVAFIGFFVLGTISTLVMMLFLWFAKKIKYSENQDTSGNGAAAITTTSKTPSPNNNNNTVSNNTNNNGYINDTTNSSDNAPATIINSATSEKEKLIN